MSFLGIGLPQEASAECAVCVGGGGLGAGSSPKSGCQLLFLANLEQHLSTNKPAGQQKHNQVLAREATDLSQGPWARPPFTILRASLTYK